ncbi:hypothetical protein K2Z84_15265 [Candidatus Binatia bacterium]|nr:hypothetical protein [Candidatus Binatia bacterium]
MRSFEPGERSSSSWRALGRRAARIAGLLALCAIFASSVRTAEAGGLLSEPCYATCGQYKWFLNHKPAVRENGACCLPLIKQAKVAEERALELYDAARDPANRDTSSDLVRAANRMIGKRSRLIRKFIDCVNGVIVALDMQKRGLDPLAEYAAACGVALECEESLP